MLNTTFHTRCSQIELVFLSQNSANQIIYIYSIFQLLYEGLVGINCATLLVHVSSSLYQKFTWSTWFLYLSISRHRGPPGSRDLSSILRGSASRSLTFSYYMFIFISMFIHPISPYWHLVHSLFWGSGSMLSLSSSEF